VRARLRRAPFGGRVARRADVIARSLQHYANRGVFRGLSRQPARGGRVEFRFTWLTRQPLTVAYEPRTGALTFRELLPGMSARSAPFAEVIALIEGRRSRAVPAHKRVDGRRARLSWSTRNGGLSLTVHVRGPHHEYGVQRGLNLVNDLFVLLHADYPDYLAEHFGLPAE
jgi:hypothetical protein